MYRWGGSRGWGEGLWMGEYLSRCSRPSPHQTHVQPHTQIQAHTCTDNQRAHWNDNLHSQTSPTRPKPSSTAWEEKKRDMSASVHSSVDAARKKPAAFIACNASSDPAWKAKNQQFPSNRSKRFSENVCHCKTCLHALLAHAGIHSLIAETTKIVYSTEYFVFVCLVNHNCKILSCREMSYIGANNIAFTSAADEPKMHTAVRRSSKPWALRVAPSTFFFHMPSNVMHYVAHYARPARKTKQYMCVQLYTIHQTKNKNTTKHTGMKCSCTATSRRHSGCVVQTIPMAVTCKCIRRKKKENHWTHEKRSSNVPTARKALLP